MSHALLATKRLALAIAFAAALLPAASQAGTVCLPSCAVDDARMLALAGQGLVTLAGDSLEIRFAIPAGTPASAPLGLEVFDGDVGSVGLPGDINGKAIPHWDSKNELVTEYSVFTDPNDDGIVYDNDKVGTWSSVGMLDNAWYSIPANAVSGVANYVLKVVNTNATTALGRNSFKIRVMDGSLSLKPQAFAFIGALSSTGDVAIVYPSYPALDPTTYDGSWDFYIAVPPGATSVAIWDGDLDFGSGDLSANDTDDPDTPATPLPPWATGTAAVFEGVATGFNGATGDPPDDNQNLLFQRSPNIRYDLIDPNGVSYANNDPSGNLEWEQFCIATDAATPVPGGTCDRTQRDYPGVNPEDSNVLPSGIWHVHMEGVDLSNLNAWRFFTEVAGVAALGDRVWNDIVANGRQDPGEPGVNDVTVELYDCDGTFLRDTVTADKAGEAGYYLFDGLLTGGCYVVKFILPDGYNFTVLSPPGLGSPATDSDADPAGIFRPQGSTPEIVLGNQADLNWDAGLVLAADPNTAALGDFVWYDLNGNGQQDDGEPGLAGSTVALWQCGLDAVVGGGDDVYTGLSQVTLADGQYLFDYLPVGCYYVTFTTPAGYAPTMANSAADDAIDSDAVDGVTGPYLLAAGDENLTVDAGFVCAPNTFLMEGNSPTTGTAGNIRTFSGASVNVNASAWSQTGSTYSKAYLGTYSGGLGVTDASENGSNPSHTLDNNGQKNYILFEFSSEVVIDSAYLGYVSGDSDIQVWIGTKTDPYTNHQTLNAALLSSLGYTEVNTGGSAARSADINAGLVSGNVLVIAAKLADSNDYVKVKKLITVCPTAAGPLTLACPANSAGTVGQPFSASLVRAGGVSPFAFSLLSGSLPGGLTLDASSGAIAGTPTTAGAFSFTAKVVDSTMAQAATAACSIGVAKPQCVDSVLSFTGSSSTSGTAGNIRTFSFSGLTAKASAWSRTKGTNGTWAKAYLGAYSGGLGVTDGSEGNGGNDTHKVDNMGRDNYVLFQFSTPIIVDQAFLDYVGADSDIQVWIGTANYSTKQTLSDAFLNGLPVKETNDTTSADSRWANVNATGLVGNVLVISASTLDTTPDDRFKLRKLDVCK